ncbi:MAG: HD domain-containing protein [Promethearchaeota archaeon]
MVDKNFILKIRQFALDNSEQDDIHGFLHVERVLNLCLKLGKKLDANLLVLEIAALLHDIGRKYKDKKNINKKHAELSAEMASKFLTAHDFKLSQDSLDNINHCIRTHSFSNNMKPQTLEAKILSDADKIDALGAIGLYRTIGFTITNKGGIDQVIQHLENKILKLRELLYLDLSKKIAEAKQQIIVDFYQKIKEEIMGLY